MTQQQLLLALVQGFLLQAAHPRSAIETLTNSGVHVQGYSANSNVGTQQFQHILSNAVCENRQVTVWLLSAATICCRVFKHAVFTLPCDCVDEPGSAD